jgi:hypothetical protein
MKQIEKIVQAFKDSGNGWDTSSWPLVDESEDEEYMPKKKKRKVASGHQELTITVLANGYMITVDEAENEDTYVFPNMKAMLDWIKSNMSPTYKNADFMEKL